MRRTIGALAGAALLAGIGAVAMRAEANTPGEWSVAKKASSLMNSSQIVPLAANDAWAFGWGSNDGFMASGDRQWPTAFRWNGRQWNESKLPSGDHGIPSGSGATSPTDVWMTTNLGVVMRWDGRAWKTEKKIPGSVTAMTVAGPEDVWVFGTENTPDRGTAWHYTRSGWSKTPTPFMFKQVSAHTPNDIWAVSPEGKAAHYDGRTWTPDPLKGALPPNEGRMVMNGVLATKDGVWITAESQGNPEPALNSYLLHKTPKGWTHQKVTSSVGRWAHETNPIPDGKGGLLLLGSTTPRDETPALIHRTPTGTWTRTPIRVKGKKTTEFRTLTSLPGTNTLLALGNADGTFTSTGALFTRPWP